MWRDFFYTSFEILNISSRGQEFSIIQNNKNDNNNNMNMAPESYQIKVMKTGEYNQSTIYATERKKKSNTNTHRANVKPVVIFSVLNINFRRHHHDRNASAIFFSHSFGHFLWYVLQMRCGKPVYTLAHMPTEWTHFGFVLVPIVAIVMAKVFVSLCTVLFTIVNKPI